MAASAPLTVVPSSLGNIFLSTEAAQIPVHTTADTVCWTATDYWGAQASGEVAVQSGAATIRPPQGRLGYFDLHLSARDGNGKEVAKANTAFAILRSPDTAHLGNSPFGVMTHFAQGWNPDIMPLLAHAGIVQIRDEQYWERVEKARGVYSFPDQFRTYMSAAAANGLHPLIEMTFANAVYDHQPDAPANAYTPCTDDGRAGFANYGKALLDQYGSQISALEVWNEYNGTWCNGPAATDRPTYYTAMLKAAYQRIKAARPGVTVLGGAAVLAPLPWFEDLLAKGALDSMDGLVVHPYRDQPEGVETDMAALVNAMKAVNHGLAKPIWATECSSSGDIEPARRASARYLVRLMTLMRSAGVEHIYWYLARDYNEFTTGLLHSSDNPLGKYAPTAAYVAYSTLIGQLNGATPVRRESITDARTRVYLFQNGGVEKRVAWTVSPPATLALYAAGPLTITNLMGEIRTAAPVNGVVTLPIDDSPTYITGPVTRVRETGRTDWLAADCVADFGRVQGAGGWSYGYFETNGGSTYDPAAFKPMTWSRSGFAYQWQSPYPYMMISSGEMGPGSGNGKPVWAVRRWQCYTTGVATISGTVALAGTQGDGVTGKVFSDGKEIYSVALGGTTGVASAPFQFTAPVKRGTLLDFVLTPGPTADINFDATSFRVQITLPL